MKRFKNVLYFVDHQPGTQRVALEQAAALSKTNDARLTVIDITAEAEHATEI